MDGVGARTLGRRDDGIAAEIGLRRRRTRQRYRDIGCCNVGRVGIRVGVHGDGRKTHVPTGREHASGDLTAIGDEHRRDRLCRGFGHLTPHIRKTPKLDVPSTGPL